MQTIELQYGSGQDYAVSGYAGPYQFIGVFDGHGGPKCIDFIRGLNMNDMARAANPIKAIFDKVQGAGDMWRSGSTCTFARISGTSIDVYNMGDSETHVFINGACVYSTDVHTFTNPSEVARTKALVKYVDPVKAPFPTSPSEVCDVLSPVGFFITGEMLVPSQSLGHNNMTGCDPSEKRIEFNPTDKVRIVCGSDGFFDMWTKDLLGSGSSESLALEAARQWRQPWNYNGSYTTYGDTIDDISLAIWENKVVELPSVCIPYSLFAFTVDDVRETFVELGHPVRKVDEVVIGDHKAFFVHFNPCELTDQMREMYLKLDGTVKVWVREKWYWHVKRSKTATAMQAVGWEYCRWDGEGDYYAFADDQISDECCVKMMAF
jgi:serine/threonine protein phosphatase PrpC